MRFAVAAMLSPASTFDTYRTLLRHIAERLGMRHRFVQRRTYDEINRLLLRGELDLAFLCSGAYAALPPDAALELVAIPIVGGSPFYHSLVIVPEDSPHRLLPDLRGARFAFTDPLSNTGHLYPTYRLTQLGSTPEAFFGSTLFTGSHDRSIVAVFRRVVDAAAVDDLIYQRLVVPDSRYWGKLRVLERSPDFPIPPVVSPISVPAETRARIGELLLGLDETPDGRVLLTQLGIDRFERGRAADYGVLRRMREATSAAQP